MRKLIKEAQEKTENDPTINAAAEQLKRKTYSTTIGAANSR